MNSKRLVQGFGAAILLMILQIWPQLTSYHAVIYHSFLPMRSVIWGLLIDLGVLSVLAALLFTWLGKNETGWRTVVWAFVAAELVSAAINALAAMHRAPIPYLRPDIAFDVTLLGALAFRWLRPSEFLLAVRGMGMLLLLLGCSMVWMLPKLAYQGLRKQRIDVQETVNQPALVSNTKSHPGDGRRIVWLLFDELSYDQAFDHRFPGLDLPAFDRFKSKSVVFSNVQPAGYYTEHVIPSLFLGRSVDKLYSTLDGKPMIRFAGGSHLEAFDANNALFADAQRLGWTTGVVGWYNPYCRILDGTLNYCFWQMGDAQSYTGALPSQSVLRNAVSPLIEVARGYQHKPSFMEQKHAEDLAVLMPKAVALIRDSSISFVFIHLPIPHPPSIFNRKQSGKSGSYIDNLALADRSFAELMSALSSTPAAANTTVIVCSDHSWRVAMWKQAWTKEDALASKGRFDPRPVLIIHFPGQQAQQVISEPFQAIRIHEIIERVLQGQDPGLITSLSDSH
jgi:Sulfatase